MGLEEGGAEEGLTSMLAGVAHLLVVVSSPIDVKQQVFLVALNRNK
jgi:hypothetical protein